MRELLADLREHWDDGYWWADRQLLLATLVAIIAGTLGLLFAVLEAAAVRHINTGGAPT